MKFYVKGGSFIPGYEFSTPEGVIEFYHGVGTRGKFTTVDFSPDGVEVWVNDRLLGILK